jgi:biofilm PGA synthesis N-glycosyltransferase PgaC
MDVASPPDTSADPRRAAGGPVLLELLFWLSLAVVAGTYLGYPLLLGVWARLARRPVLRAPVTPSVTVIVAARDEAARIGGRVANLFASDYPADRLEVVVVSDGSADGTDRAVQAIAASEPRVRVVTLDRPRGKAAALNAGVAAARGEVLVFADARQRFAPDAIRRLVENFADPAVGVVSGRLVLDDGDATAVARGVGFYWRHEVWLRERESEVGSMLGATGAIYAMRRSLYRPIPDDTVLDDVLIPMEAVLAGARAVFDARALAFDAAARSGAQEFSRKVRTLYGNYQLLALRPELLSPRRNPVFGRFVLHKLSRLAVPVHLVVLAVTSLLLLEGVYAWALAGQVAAYLAAAVGALRARRGGPVARLTAGAYVFVLLNWAALVALVRFAGGDRHVWAKQRL